MASMMGLPCAESAPPPTLAALREARARRAAAIRRRTAPVGLAITAVLAVSIARSHPRPGLEGTPLAITLAGGCFLVSFAVLVRLAGSGLAAQWPARPAVVRARLLATALLVASSVTLEWLDSASAGAIGLYLVVALAVRAYSRRVSAVVFGACLAYFLASTLMEYAVWNNGKHGMPGIADVIAVAAVYVMSMFAQQLRVHQNQEERLLLQLEESRAAELRTAAMAERQRLAREMHDVLAHSLSGLVVQLEGARMLAAAAPGDARLPEAVDRAHRLARSGLEEARQAIGMLRDADDELPGPDRLPELASGFTADTGIPCRFEQGGEYRELPPAVRLALYRVTQEALTNARRHARPDEVDVSLDYLPGAVALTVEDIAMQPLKVSVLAGGPATPGGYGLAGMRERAGLLGGVLDAGPTETGFRVRLRVPA
jgi:signal transduction histidine kinase